MRLDFCGFGGRGGWMDEMETEGYNNFLELGALTYAAIYLERPILSEIWEGGDSWAGLGWVGLDYC